MELRQIQSLKDVSHEVNLLADKAYDLSHRHCLSIEEEMELGRISEGLLYLACKLENRANVRIESWKRGNLKNKNTLSL